MAKLLFPLRNVPHDEALAVRDLLDKNNYRWYETTAGNWGIATPAIWIEDNAEWQSARDCIDHYQEQLLAEVQDDYKQQVREGRQTTLLSAFLQNPLLYLLAIAGTLFILYVSVVPFFSLITSANS